MIFANSSDQDRTIPPQRSASGNTVTFKLTGISDGFSDDGTISSTFDLAASDGEKLYKLNRPFATVKRAALEFRRYLQASEETTRNVAEVDGKGKIVGQRAVIRFHNMQSSEAHYTIFWTHGALFQQITGENLQNLLTLESLLRENSLLEIVKK
ncbi:MAG TPA: hypothetical protein VGI16_08120 [Candidatus Acidoferrum sp.]|jgi:hypothetical protein